MSQTKFNPGERDSMEILASMENVGVYLIVVTTLLDRQLFCRSAFFLDLYLMGKFCERNNFNIVQYTVCFIHTRVINHE